MISRRTFLGLVPLASVRFGQDGGPTIERHRDGPLLRTTVSNRTSAPLRVNDVTIFEESVSLPPATALYGEGFQMLSQTAGTIGAPVDLSQYTDSKHYRMPAPAGARTFYGLMSLTPPSDDARVYAFTSCRRFSGRFDVMPSSVRAVVDCEGLLLRPGESWQLEELMMIAGRERADLLDRAGAQLAKNHPRLPFAKPPTGWCSWYCFGPNVTAAQVLDNLDVIVRSMPSLRYVQIDDGYQRAMGDWLETGSAFGGSVRTVLAEIRKRGFEPAIWVAPFVAEADSHLFQQHPEWFIKDDAGAPLRSDRVTFGGWRRGPWYAVDGTHPGAQAHLEHVFRSMREEWGCTYFKLDANFWGAMHGGRFHDPRATRIEAYRRGMEAIRRGAGDGFLLGCNHPIWPSVGLIHGSRSSNDIKRSWDRIASTARQNLSRNWQNARLWWNDPDAIVLAGKLTDAECQFHATAIYATGGMLLSGDDLTKIPEPRAAILRKLLPPTGVAARFTDADLRVGVVTLPGSQMLCLFNWDDAPADINAAVHGRRVRDFWSGDAVDHQNGRIALTLSPRSARLLEVTA